jgi:hypothetical protein
MQLLSRSGLAVRAFATIISYGLLAGCSAAAAPTTPVVVNTTGYVVWKIDGNSCTGADAINFYLDGSVVGTQTLTAGVGSSSAYPTPQGTHLISARENRTGGFVWPTQTVAISAGGTFTSVLTCS